MVTQLKFNCDQRRKEILWRTYTYTIHIYFSPALGTAGRSSGGAISNITPEMMSAALQQAIASTSTASTPSTASASTSTSTPTETKEVSIDKLLGATSHLFKKKFRYLNISINLEFIVMSFSLET